MMGPRSVEPPELASLKGISYSCDVFESAEKYILPIQPVGSNRKTSTYGSSG
jgi:hypothetical protein